MLRLVNMTTNTQISYEDQAILEMILDHCDHPAYVDYDPVYVLFDRFKLAFWCKNVNINSVCSFCQEMALYHNKYVEMCACIECMADIKNKEIDVLDPQDHPMSIKLRNILCDWANKNHWCRIPSESYFNEYDLNCDMCYICNMSIRNNDSDIAIATGCRAVAHSDCATSSGFQNYFTEEEYNIIFSDLDVDITHIISSINENPSYTPTISDEDKAQLKTIYQSIYHLDDLDLVNNEISDLFRYLHQKYWKELQLRQGCTFCLYESYYHNETLNIFACRACMQKIRTGNINILFPELCPSCNNPSIDFIQEMDYVVYRCLKCDGFTRKQAKIPGSPCFPYPFSLCSISIYLAKYIDKWAEKLYLTKIVPMNAGSLFDNYNITHDICDICKHIIKRKHDVIVHHNAIVHETCMGSYGLIFKSYHRKFKKSILRSRQFNLCMMIENLQLNIPQI